jgi:8-oxo-dGTP pyrophosphatase MutT (NUDIX family)
VSCLRQGPERRAARARRGAHRPALGRARAAARRAIDRSGVVIVEDGCVALIKRVRDGHTYYLTPGGGVEDGETFEQAAHREAWEELGVELKLGGVLLDVRFGGALHRHFQARIVGGEFGRGAWPDHEHLTLAEKAGTHDPVWVPVAELGGLDVRPPQLVPLLVSDVS